MKISTPICDSFEDFPLKTFIRYSTTAEKVAFFLSLGLTPHSRWLAELEEEAKQLDPKRSQLN